MKRQTKIILIICVAVLIAAVVAFFLLKKKSLVGDGVSNGVVSGGGSAAEEDILLKRGDRGAYVEKLQSFLSNKILCRYIFDKPKFMYNGQEMTALEIDGIFGPKTEAACEWWFGKKTVQLSEIK